MQRTLPEATKEELKSILSSSLEKCEENFVPIAGLHGRTLGLTDEETQQYLEAFNYRLGEREREAMSVFRTLVQEFEPALIGS
jgi:predicted solute-binding protein